jgi:ankyrin repeat protein
MGAMSRDLAAEFQREQLHAAAAEGDLARVDELLRRGYRPNRFDGLGRTPLHHAAAHGHLAVAERLIRAGANVNAHDDRMIGDTPLGASVPDCSYAMAKLLIDAGADPTIPGWMQLSALDRVARRADTAAPRIRRLLEAAAPRSRRLAKRKNNHGLHGSHG